MSFALSSILGIFLFLFLFWRRLKEDYAGSQIFSTAFYVLFGILAANLTSLHFFPLYWFWTSFFVICLGLALGILRFHLRVFETLEAFVIGILPWLGLIFLSDFIEKPLLSSGIGALMTLLLILLFFFLDTHYRSFSWYKSGRIGFSGLTITGIFFLIRAAVAVSFSNVLSFVGGKETIFSGILAFTSFLAVFNLAREKT